MNLKSLYQKLPVISVTLLFRLHFGYKIEYFDFDNILLDKISCENIFI